MDQQHVPPADRRPVRQLRVVVVVEDFDRTVGFFRDALGMPERLAFAEGGGDRVAILDAGSATLEIASPAHGRAIDRVEADGSASPRIRLALEVDDAAGTTDRLVDLGAVLVAAPVTTPWRSLNPRLETPGDLTVTLFQETTSADDRARGEGFATDAERSGGGDAS